MVMVRRWWQCRRCCHLRQALARALDLPATKPGGGEQSDGYFVAAKRGMLVVATAMLFHHRLQGYLPAQRPDGYNGDWPPASATGCAEQSAPVNAFREAWRGILAVDYRPVFETGRAALAELTADPDTGQAVRSLAEVVARVSERVTGLRHDPLGRIFHPGSGYRPLRRFLLYLHRRRGAVGDAGLARAGRGLVRPECRRRSPHLRSRLRYRDPAHGGRRAHPRPAQRRRTRRPRRRRGPRPASGGRRAVGL